VVLRDPNSQLPSVVAVSHDGDRRWFRPADGVEPVAELIEPPIVVTKRPADRPEPSRAERV